MLSRYFGVHPGETPLVRLFFVAIILSIAITPLSQNYSLALANPETSVLLNLPIYSQTSSDDLIAQAESMVSREISRQFANAPDLSHIEVTVLGNRNGDIIPVLITAVSREQWQQTPSVSAWTNYYRSYALFERHDTKPTQRVATTPRNRRSNLPDISIQFDRQYDAGVLSGRELQSNLSFLD